MSRYNEQEGAGATSGPGPANTPPARVEQDSTWGGASPLPATRRTRIVGFNKLKALLQPVHSYFKDKIGFIKTFSVYEDISNTLVYPQVGGREWSYGHYDRLHRDNPYRRKQLNGKASSRTFKKLKHFAESQGLDDFEVAMVDITFPKFMSEYFSRCGKNGRAMAWNVFKAWWKNDLHDVIGQGIELGGHVNLHLWRSEKPWDPHYHFHALIPNYGLKESMEYVDGDDQPVWVFDRWKWHKQRGGTVVPFSDEQLKRLKLLWFERMQRWSKRHGFTVEWQQHIERQQEKHGDDYAPEKTINLWVNKADTWVKLHHRLAYNGRHWSENYAEVSNGNPDAPDPPEWLEHYENKARVFGWWSNLNGMFKHLEKDIEKVSPYTGEIMSYVCKSSLHQVFNMAGDEGLSNVEFVRGKAFENDLSANDLEWLKGVMADADSIDTLDLDAT